jgi:type VI secretion system protein ImpM
VGVFAPSVDKVGRNFPLAVFVPVQNKEAGAQFPVLPATYRPFLDAAVALLAESPQLDGHQLAERLPSLPLPSPEDLASAETTLHQSMATERASGLSERAFGDPIAGHHYYGFWTFQSACNSVRGREPARANVAVDCPASGEVDLFAWLDLARRTLRWPAPPPFFWRDGAAGHLLLSLGAASGALLAYLSDPSWVTNKVWPLRTTQPAAVAAARRALGPAQLAAIDRTDATLENLIELLSC